MRYVQNSTLSPCLSVARTFEDLANRKQLEMKRRLANVFSV